MNIQMQLNGLGLRIYQVKHTNRLALQLEYLFEMWS